MTSKDTPGIATPRPWTMEARFDRVVILGDGGDLMIAQLGPWTRDVEEANAALIIHRVNHYEQLIGTLRTIDAIMCDKAICGHFTTEEIREQIEAALLLCGEGRGETTT